MTENKPTCSYPECGRPARNASLCKSHYEMKRTGKELRPLKRYMPRGAECSFSGCDGRVQARGLCNGHYLQAASGKTLTPVKRVFATYEDRIAHRSEVDPDTGCRVWTGHISYDGYARASFGGKSHLVHRVAYSEAYGDIDSHETINHLCGNRACNAPEHLVGASHLENSQFETVNARTRGASFDAKRGKWKARATVNWVQYYVGMFETEEEAAKAAREFRRNFKDLERVMAWEDDYLAQREN